MPAYTRWSGEHLWNLLHLDWEAFHTKYPDVTKNTWKGKRGYWRKKIMSGETLSPEAPEPKLVKSWESAAFNRETNEWETTTLHSYDHLPDEDAYLFQAAPANITPTNREVPVRDYRSIFVFSDAQIDFRLIDNEFVPLHDERAIQVAQLICADLQPDVIVNLGDTVDNAAFSRFKPDSTHFQNTMRKSHQVVHDIYAQLRADNPTARIVEVDSNHNVRPRNWMLQHMPQIYDMRQAGTDEEFPIWSYPFLANLKHVGVEWVGGYGAAEFHYSDDLVFRHGNTAVANGSTAAKVSKQEPELNVVQGHAHRAETFHRTTRGGKYLASIVVGALCKTTGEVPSYHSAIDDRNQVVKHQEDWVNSVMEIQDYGDGNYLFHHIYIRDGSARYNGKEYTSE